MIEEQRAFARIKAFCECWFEQRNAQKTMQYLSPDVSFMDAENDETVSGIKEMSAYINSAIAQMTDSFSCTLKRVHFDVLTPDTVGLALQVLLQNTQYNGCLRAYFILHSTTEGQLAIRNIQFSTPNISHGEGKPVQNTFMTKRMAMQQVDLLKDALMGGYNEPGYPFYFISRQMLNYLGYENEAEFVQRVDGLIANCRHPDDRAMVNVQVKKQLAQKNEYTIEYRMKKRDGSYIWVHDQGREIIAEDGRQAIVSVCVDVTQQRRTQEEILHLYNSIPGAVFSCRLDDELTVVEANERLYEYLGYSREEFAALGSKLSSVLYSGEMQRLRPNVMEQVHCGDSFHCELRVVCKDQSTRWVSIRGQRMLEDEPQSVPCYYCVFVDVTQEKRLRDHEKELYDKQLSYFTAASAAEGIIQGRINLTQNVVESCRNSSDVVNLVVGTTYDAFMENYAATITDAEQGDRILEEMRRERVINNYGQGKTQYHTEILRRRSGGGCFWGSTNMYVCTNPETGDLICFFYTMDVTKQKLQNQLLTHIVKLDYESVTTVDMHHDVIENIVCNEHLTGLLSNEKGFKENVDWIADRFIQEESREEYRQKLSYAYIKAELQKNESYAFTVKMKGSQRDEQVKRIEVFYVDREFGSLCIARTDVTQVIAQEKHQRDELAAALVAAEQANAAKTDFLSRMSHEIRTPMNAIIGMSAIAAQCIGDDEQVSDCISKIGISSRFLLSLINDILDMSRIESGKMLLKNEKIPMEEFINGINAICYAQAEAKNVDYECIIDPTLDDYYIGDAMKLQQVLLNMLSNAIKFTSESGKVTFTAVPRRRTKNDAALRFVINDTGVGMSEEFLPHIFEPFSQESSGTTAVFGGTGLGLAISKSIVDMMDGHIAVRSIKGIGSEFTVDVKLGITEDEKLRHNQRKEMPNFSNLYTLVVDDDVTVCESAVVTLREIGVKAEWVDSGHKAICRVQELKQAKKYFDMILIDWKMPEMDGIETARRIRAIVGPDVTIIIMTAYDWVSIEHEAKMAGVNLLMSKPMFKSSLISAFSKVLSKAEAEEPVKPTDELRFDGRRVLLAEDNAINTEVAVMLLTRKGFAVENAENGLRALEMFSKSKEGYYDAVLMDIRMPLMDGLTAAKNIRHLSNTDAKRVPIIAMTANAFDDDIEKSKAAGMNAHLAKPIDPQRLYQTLYDFIEKGK